MIQSILGNKAEEPDQNQTTPTHPELIRRFRVTVFEKEVLITCKHNLSEAFQKKICIKFDLKIGWHDWIDTADDSFNYYEACGILILFGIQPPTFSELNTLFNFKPINLLN